MSPGPLRAPQAGEAAALAALCRRSKGHWGYDEAFLDACRDALRIDPGLAARDLVRVAELDGSAVGVVQVSPQAEAYGLPFESDAELDLLFVEPSAMGRGIGRALFRFALDATRRLGRPGLAILSDPGARSFYERQGAVFVREAPSDVIEGRKLPLLRHHLQP